MTRLESRSLLSALVLAGACGGGDGLVGPASDDCAPPPYFTALPVATSDFGGIAIWGGLGAPGHTLPTAHTGFGLTTEGATVRSPGDLQITRLRRVRYLASPNRQGVADYATEFQVCKQVSGWFGHITSLAISLQPAEDRWGDCQTYSTATETVQSCSAALDEVTLSAGDVIGTGGHSISLGLMGLDFGLRDSRVHHAYANPSRHNPDMFTAICPWDQFTAPLREQLYARLTDGGRPGVVPAGEPRCGTMEVDVPNTAKGIWVVQGASPQPGNETDYITLANYPYRPGDHLALSLGPAPLGARVAVVTRQVTGRVNRAFEQVTSDGQIYCYGPDASRPTTSWLLGLTSSAVLQVRMVSHTLGAGPCLADPSTWSLTGAISLVR